MANEPLTLSKEELALLQTRQHLAQMLKVRRKKISAAAASKDSLSRSHVPRTATSFLFLLFNHVCASPYGGAFERGARGEVSACSTRRDMGCCRF